MVTSWVGLVGRVGSTVGAAERSDCRQHDTARNLKGVSKISFMSPFGDNRAPGRLLSFLPRCVTQLVESGAGAGSAVIQTAAVLSADISGFTALADGLAQASGTGGAEALQRRLNQVIAPTVAQLTAGGGDVMGFAGDSVLALFVDDASDSDRCVTAALGAAEAGIVQARSVGLGLRVGISAGPVTVALFGDEGRAHVACLGDAVVAAMEAQRTARVGHVETAGVRSENPERRFEPSAMPALPAAAFLPAGRGEQVAAGRSLLLSERRAVTSVFVALPAVLSRPERRDDLQREIVSALAAVRTQGGDLRQVEITPGGPVLVCAFGAMFAGVDDEVRAVACARDLVDSGAARAVGVATGPVFCGELGTVHRRDLAVVGGSVNLAARLMGAASNREILIDETTRAGIAGIATGSGSVAPGGFLEPLPQQLSVRGLARPVRAWRARTGFGRDDGGTALGSTDLVGRATELELLLDAADRIAARRDPAADDGAADGLTAQAVGSDDNAGDGCVYVVRGPAGIGKSALAAAVVGARTDQIGLTVRFSARETGWAPWGRCVRSMLDLPIGDATTPVDAVETALSQLGVPQVDGQIDLLRPVLSLAGDGGVRGLARSFDGRGRDELLASFLSGIVQAFARRHRAVLVLEDAHLAGPELDRVLAALLPPATGVLVLVLDRTDDSASASPRIGRFIDLTPLEPEDARTLARAHIPTGMHPDVVALVERVVEFGSGNPLHLEQLALHLAGDADWSGSTEVDDPPRGLSRVLRARLDRLPALARDITAVASVIEEDIRADLLLAAYPALGTAEIVRAELDRLVDQSVLVAGGPGRYRFHHAMVRTVAYSGIGLRARQDLHAAFGHHLARTIQTPSRAGTGPESRLPELELVAWHFLHSRDTQAKRRWLDLAGRAARDAWSLTTARRWYAALTPLVGEPRRTTATLALAEVQFMTGDWAEARAGYDEIMRRADPGTEAHAAAAHGLGVLALRTSSIPVAVNLLTDAVNTWSDLDRPDRLLASLDRLTFAHHVAGDVEPALAAAHRLLAVAEAVGDPGARADALETAALAAWTAGDLDTAAARLTAALVLARSVGNLRCVVHGLSDLAGVRLDQGNDEAALAGLTEADAAAERIGYRRAQVSLRANRGEVLRRRGQLDAARDQLVSALSSVLVLGDTYVATSVVGNLGLVEAAAGRRTSARRILTSAVNAATAGGQESFRREFADALAQLDVGDDDAADWSGGDVDGLLHRLDSLINSMDRAL
jgi:class 3 adenylate cyclase/tetratricopeptide (TPR) repeat protein